MSSELEKISSTMLKALDEGRSNFVREFEKQTKELDEMREKFAREMEKETKEQEVEYAKLMKEKEAFEREKKMMHKIIGKASDVIKINAGGRKFTTKRSTITQVENSILANMFSGSYEDDEKQESVFLDLDPDCFAKILLKLRDQVITGKKVSWEQVPGPSGREKHFVSVLRYLGLLRPTSQRPPILTFASHGNKIELSSNKRTATNKDKFGGHCFALGGDILSSGDSWGLKINHIHMQHTKWLMLGILGEKEVPQERSHKNSTCYGWAGPACIYSEGKRTGCRWAGFSKGDNVTLMICETYLKMKIQRLGNMTFTLEIPANSRWRVHVNLCGSNDSVELVQAFEEMS